MATSNLGCVVVAVDSREESMKALRWALDNLRLGQPPPEPRADPGNCVKNLYHAIKNVTNSRNMWYHLSSSFKMTGKYSSPLVREYRKRMFLGSVSKYCVNHVSCPVLVIKGI
ncbi:hypothetical protein ACMD2_24843 [Ananas comosus]|uniref:UspA domain-containing protein n=1 Tax=Ananas comosus TaxID=4615 RepID=A0A199V333_ANACO|nr:hypothetical protein ACMD2_24843 [Ananas comosus]